VQLHDSYVDALDSFVASGAQRRGVLDDLHGEELMGFLWAPDTDIERVEAACDELGLEVLVRGLDVELCPG
jgi:hypothetical protein